MKREWPRKPCTMGDSRPSPAVPKFHRRATVIALRSSCGPESDNPCAEFETIGLRKKAADAQDSSAPSRWRNAVQPTARPAVQQALLRVPWTGAQEQQNCIMENSDSKIYSDRKLKIFETLPLLRIPRNPHSVNYMKIRFENARLNYATYDDIAICCKYPTVVLE